MVLCPKTFKLTFNNKDIEYNVDYITNIIFLSAVFQRLAEMLF